MSVHIKFILSEKCKFSLWEKIFLWRTVRAEAKRSLEILGGEKSLVTFLLYPQDHPEIKVSGETEHTGEVVRLVVPPRGRERVENLPPLGVWRARNGAIASFADHLRSVVAHEIHHTQRLRDNGCALNQSLLEAVFAEGLASAFAMQYVPSYVAMQFEDRLEMVKHYIPELLDMVYVSDYNHS